MSKLKLGFSALFMLILMSMFATFAAAEGTFPIPGTLDVDNFGNTNTHRTHGNFQNNTNSCANCHSTHNGTDAMLLKSGEYELCLSCHDGTMGFYDVSLASEAGVMGSTEMSASMHNVNSELAVKSAPGALANTSNATFECSSCHNPHGSANDRLLKETGPDGKTYASTYDVHFEGYHETITPLAAVPVGTKGIKLNLTLDSNYDAINNSQTLSGLKIYKSSGIYNKATETITQSEVYNYKLNYSEFCATCHDDYMKNREEGPRADGVHYTHTTSSTKAGRSCTACHYAHGTDITLLKDTAGDTIADLQSERGWTEEKAKEYMKDVSKSGSSALKRYTNMAVCWACHQSTHAIANTPGTASYPGPLVPGGDYSGKAGIK